MLSKSVACVVPARLDSSRFPGKLLRPLAGEPVIVHTLRRAREADCFDSILCLTDSPEIAAAARAAGFDALLIENMHDAPYVTHHDPAVVAAMTAAALAVRDATPDLPLGVQVLAIGYRTGEAWNESGWSDPEWDKKLNAALAVADAGKRKEMMQDIEQILQDAGIIIQPFWRKLYNHSVEAVQNGGMHPTFEHDYGKVWLKQA